MNQKKIENESDEPRANKELTILIELERQFFTFRFVFLCGLRSFISATFFSVSFVLKVVYDVFTCIFFIPLIGDIADRNSFH